MTQVNLVQLDQVLVQFTCNVSPFNSSSDHWVVSLYNNDTFSGRMMTRSKKNNQGKLLVKVVWSLASLYCASGLIPSLVSMWVEVVVGSHPCSKSFWLGPSIFLHPQKSTFQIPIQPVTVDKRSYLMECSLWNLISITSVSFNQKLTLLYSCAQYESFFWPATCFFFQWAYNDFCRIAPSAKAASELIITMKKSKLQRNEHAKCIILCRVKILRVIKFQGKRVQTLLKFILLKFLHASQALICVVFSFTWIFSKVHVWLISLWKWKWMFLVYVLVNFSL